MRISNEANGADRRVHAIQMLAGLVYCLALSMKVVDQDSLLLLLSLRPMSALGNEAQLSKPTFFLC
jgi:hypothetical protein